MNALYDSDRTEAFFDAYGSREWERLEATPADRVSFYIHRHYLSRYIKSGERVLEAGAGSGRWTIELARLGAQIVVGDISAVQLDLNKKHVREAGLEGAVEARGLLDITDLSAFGGDSVDAVVLYGGPLSYVMDRSDDAVVALTRVLKPGGFLLLSVMSLIGATRIFLEGIMTLENYPDILEGVNRDGILTGEHNGGHPMKLYRYAELRGLLEGCGCKVVAASATNLLTAGRTEALQPLVKTALWDRLLDWELEFCAEEGALDCGTHVLAVAQKAEA